MLDAELEDEPVVVAVWLDDQLIIEGTVRYEGAHCNWTEFTMQIGPGPHRLRAQVFNTSGDVVIIQVGVGTKKLPEFHDEIVFTIDGPATGFLTYQRSLTFELFPEGPWTHGLHWHFEEGQRPLICI